MSSYYWNSSITDFRKIAIQLFMWLYMVSFYVDASTETRKRRLPYILASLVILLLSSAANITSSIHTYQILFEIAPGLENLDASLDILDKYYLKLAAPASLVGDIGLRVTDLVLVGSLFLLNRSFKY